MPTAIIAGLPPEIDRRVQSALKQRTGFAVDWELLWMRSKGKIPGLAPSQLEEARQMASDRRGAHLLIFRGRQKSEQELVFTEITPYFRVRWIDEVLLKLVPHSMDQFFQTINDVLAEEIEWINTVKPRDEASCLLLPECAFAANSAVQHLWTAATEAGIERIRLAARVIERFGIVHWLSSKNGVRRWIDAGSRVFDHRGPRHGVAPLPRSWKFSYCVSDGFHYDVTSRDSRAFHLNDQSSGRHTARANEHINIDPHGYVRA